ncbi:hypothetical protein KY290_002056 [Solanum tuberosum]|uniref:Uncharacterized protein n=1 Tax=Solanum tuberosum TaxID=4113 RepID=A0ABQ7WQW9_SOLTU|nr:hypothetical protein KY289_002214 [Solanum tuberosum]KAH0782458.1 hypothetical protein KY290_002056 [Solanum tuberosum]
MREKVRGKNTFSLCEIRKWRTHSILWVHRIKRKAALSWQSFRRQETLGLVGASERNESKPKTDQGSLQAHQTALFSFLQDLARTVRQIPTRYAPVRHFVLNSSHLLGENLQVDLDEKSPFQNGFSNVEIVEIQNTCR